MKNSVFRGSIKDSVLVDRFTNGLFYERREKKVHIELNFFITHTGYVCWGEEFLFLYNFYLFYQVELILLFLL